MSELIQMPEVEELKSELATAKAEIQETIKQEPEIAEQSKFLMEVLAILEEKIANQKDLNTLPKNEQVSILAHLNLFYNLLEDLYLDSMEDEDFDEDFDDEDFEDDEDLDDEE